MQKKTFHETLEEAKRAIDEGAKLVQFWYCTQPSI